MHPGQRVMDSAFENNEIQSFICIADGALVLRLFNYNSCFENMF